MASILILKVLASLVFFLLYVVQWKNITTNEARICFLFFFVLYFIGGGVASIVVEDVNYFLPESGLYQVKSNFFSWVTYFTFVYLVPYVFVWIVELVVREKDINNQTSVLAMDFKWAVFFFFLYLFFLYINIDLKDVVGFKGLGYANQVKNRYLLDFQPSFQFVALVFGFLLTYNLSFFIIVKNKGFLKLFIGVVVILVYLVVVERVFFSKLYFMGLFISLFFSFFIFSRISKVKLFLGSLFCFTMLLFYYSVSVYGGVGNISTSFIKAVSRYTIPIYYYVNYYMAHDFEGGFYFSGMLTGQAQNYIRDVYDYAFLVSDTDVVGTLSSGLIVHNFANSGALALILSFLEFFVLIFLYRLFRMESNNSLNLSIFSFLIFSIMNYSFMSVLANPGSGMILIFFILFITKFFRQLKQ